MPIFSSTPARITEPAVGASTCASGSQVWNGNSGTLIANASANARKNQNCEIRRNLQVVELQRGRSCSAGRRAVQVREAEDRQQHQHAAGHRVQHELDRRVDAPVVAPDADEEVHRDEHRVPEDVEEEQVERDEDADHRALEQQHEDAERLRLLVRPTPTTEERERRQKPGQHEEQQADAVDADGVADPERGNPRVALDELEIRRAGSKRAHRSSVSANDQQRHRRAPPAAHRPSCCSSSFHEEQHEARPTIGSATETSESETAFTIHAMQQARCRTAAVHRASCISASLPPQVVPQIRTTPRNSEPA